jgi:hypothetical protein
MKRHWTLTVLAVAIASFTVLWLRHVGDISRFMVLGGYDGQYYYRLAIAPFSTAPVVAGVRFDYPAYRQQRIGYPLLVHVLSGGNPRAVLWLLPIVNCAAIIAIGWSGLRLAPDGGVLAAFWPGFLMSLARDLTEPLEVALLFAAIVLSSARKPWFCTLALTCAALTRETALVAAVVFVIVGVRHRDFRFAAGLTAIVAFAIWKGVVFAMWHLPFNLGAGNVIGLPFAGITSFVRAANRIEAIELIVLAIFALLVFSAIRRSTAGAVAKLSFVAYACLAIVLTREIWVEDWAFLRALSEFGAFGGLIIATSTKLIRRAGAVLVVGGWAALAFDLLRFR